MLCEDMILLREEIRDIEKCKSFFYEKLKVHHVSESVPESLTILPWKRDVNKLYDVLQAFLENEQEFSSDWPAYQGNKSPK